MTHTATAAPSGGGETRRDFLVIATRPIGALRPRPAGEVEGAKAANRGDLPDPKADDVRVQKGEWLILVGVCTHLGCIPLGQRLGDARGEFGGWFCPCHGSHYDTSGRIRKGPAPKNLAVPQYTFLDDNKIKIG